MEFELLTYGLLKFFYCFFLDGRRNRVGQTSDYARLEVVPQVLNQLARALVELFRKDAHELEPGDERALA